MKRLSYTIGFLFIVFFLFLQPSFAKDKGREYYEKTGDVIWDVKTKEKVIALTFDDGPHPTFTPQILDLLAKYDAKATFFVMGQHAEEYPQLILRQKIEGHEIGNHTFSHSYSMSPDQLNKELMKTDRAIFEITGFYPIFYRPVGGEYNDHIINTAVQNGFRVMMWSWHQDTQDWKRPGANQIVNKVLSGARAGDVVLFHDAGGDRSQTVQALEEILQELKGKGFKFVTVSELINTNGMEVSQ